MSLQIIETIVDLIEMSATHQEDTVKLLRQAIKDTKAQPDYRPVKTYHEGNPVYVSQPEQEPVAWQWLGSAHFRKKLPKNADITAWNPLYTTPPKREWVGLTDAEAQLIYDMGRTPSGMMEMVESKLKEKNT